MLEEKLSHELDIQNFHFQDHVISRDKFEKSQM